MKRVYIGLLALLLLLTGCAGKGKTRNISVKDVLCPYTIVHKKDAVEITLRDSTKSGILWQAEMIPEDFCKLSQGNTEKENTCKYTVTGLEEGVAQLTFTGSQEDGTEVFILNVVVETDADYKVAVTSCYHQEMKQTAVEADGLNYKWNLDADGALHFFFINDEDTWRVRAEKEDVCVLTSKMSNPSGCEFVAKAKAAGQASVLVVGVDTQRQIQVVIQVDDNGKMEVISVQEQ